MNFTERYIKMCEEAKEIQKKYQDILKRSDDEIDRILEGWYVYNPKYYGKIHLLANSDLFIHNDMKFLRSSIWLPTQEQLQEMVELWGSDAFRKMDYVLWILRKEYIFTTDLIYWQNFNLFKEFWLAFVMWTKYHKVWDDEKEEWRKI